MIAKMEKKKDLAKPSISKHELKNESGKKRKFMKKMKKPKAEAAMKQESKVDMSAAVKMATSAAAGGKRKHKKKTKKPNDEAATKGEKQVKTTIVKQEIKMETSPKSGKKHKLKKRKKSNADAATTGNEMQVKTPTAVGQKRKFKQKMGKTKVEQQNETQESSPKKKKMQSNYEKSPADTPSRENVRKDKKKRKMNTDSGPQQKKMRFEGRQKNDWKQKKSPKQKYDSDNQVPQYKTGKEWKQLHNLKKGKPDITEPSKILLTMWEELRREKCSPERKAQLLKEATVIVNGRIREFVFAHDTVRVMETIVGLANESLKGMFFKELKDDFIELSKSKYAKFLVIKMLRCGSKAQKEQILKAFQGKIVSLIRNDVAGEVIEIAYNECANSKKRLEFVEEFYGPTFKFFKDSNLNSLAELLEKHPDKKSVVLEHMMNELLKVLDKTAVKHSLVHSILLQFLNHCDKGWRSDIIESLREVVPEILHTKEGAKVAMECVCHGSVKDRKVMVKSMKPFVSKIAMEEYGHMVLLTLFDNYDDTVVLTKCIIDELMKNAVELSKNVHGRKVLIYLLNPRDSHYAHPDIVRKLRKGEGNEVSKKDPEVRQAELKAVVVKPFLDLLKDNIKSSYTDNSFCLFAATILRHIPEGKEEVFMAIAELVMKPHTTENRNTHPIENQGFCFMLKQILRTESSDMECTLSEVLVSTLSADVLRSWTNCNRGVFVLVHLIETKIPSVVEKLKAIFTGYNTTLAKKTFPGAELFLKKLRE